MDSLPDEPRRWLNRRYAGAVSGRDQITVTQAPADINQAFWSPDGGLLYYVTSSAGTSSLMARRLDGSRHRAGPPFRVFQFPGRMHPHGSWGDNQLWQESEALTALPGRFVGAMSEDNNNIWIMDLPKY